MLRMPIRFKYDRVIGKMAACIPLLGYISIYIKTPLGIAVVCGIISALILLNFLLSIKENEEEKDVWYYQYIVGKTNIDQKIILFDHVLIPNWGNDVAGKTLNITIEAAGIQADNFSPEISENPLTDNVWILDEINGKVVEGDLKEFKNAIIGWDGITPEKHLEK